MNKKTVLLFVFDGFADWEPSYAMVGIRKSDCYTIKTIAIKKNPVISMGGMCIFPVLDFFPEVDLNDIDNTNTAMLILPGGTAWEENKNLSIKPLIAHCIHAQIPIAAICGATVFLADMGLLDTVDHTSNDLDYIKGMSPSYQGECFYQDKPCVIGDNIITATGTASIEFAKTIFEVLDIYDNVNTSLWFQYFDSVAV